jgi:hypothetical protein
MNAIFSKILEAKTTKYTVSTEKGRKIDRN